MKHRLPFLALSMSAVAAAIAVATPASADLYGGVDIGSASLDSTGPFGAPVAAFPGPTVDHDLCGGTATITLGPEPDVNSISDRSTEYRVFIGWRVADAWSVEGGRFNIARLAGAADSAPYAVAQPTCNPVPTTPITVDAFGRQLETVAFDGWTLTPVYSFELAEHWTLDLRATVAFWSREDRSQWQVVVTELQGGNPLQTYPTAGVSGSGSDSGTDIWPGLGVSWQMKDGLRLRGIVEQENFGDLSTLSWTLGLAIDFD